MMAAVVFAFAFLFVCLYGHDDERGSLLHLLIIGIFVPFYIGYAQ